MTWSAFLFSPSGRINRARYWGALLLQYTIMIGVWVPVIVVSNEHMADTHPIAAIVYLVAATVMTIAFVASHIFTQIKRFHDRDKPWPWIFIGFIPYIGGIWLLVELGMLSGTRGRNRYGADPLGNVDDLVDVFGGPTRTPPSLAPEDIASGIRPLQTKF